MGGRETKERKKEGRSPWISLISYCPSFSTSYCIFQKRWKQTNFLLSLHFHRGGHDNGGKVFLFSLFTFSPPLCWWTAILEWRTHCQDNLTAHSYPASFPTQHDSRRKKWASLAGGSVCSCFLLQNMAERCGALGLKPNRFPLSSITFFSYLKRQKVAKNWEKRGGCCADSFICRLPLNLWPSSSIDSAHPRGPLVCVPNPLGHGKRPSFPSPSSFSP